MLDRQDDDSVLFLPAFFFQVLVHDQHPPPRPRRKRSPCQRPPSCGPSKGNRSRGSRPVRTRSRVSGGKLNTAATTVGERGDDYPYLAEVVLELGTRGYDYTEEFEFGLDFILDGLERFRRRIR